MGAEGGRGGECGGGGGGCREWVFLVFIMDKLGG